MAKFSDTDINLLERLTAHAAEAPCQGPKADLFRLLILAGFSQETVLWRDVDGRANLVLFSADAL